MMKEPSYLESITLGEMRLALLSTTLAAVVPIAIHDLQKINGGNISDHDIEYAREQLSEIIASGGDILLYRGKKKGESAKVFAATVRALATMAFCEGGVTIFDMHFEVKPEEESRLPD